MPLHDHFYPPMALELPWDTLHSSWASDLARRLNSHWLRRPFRAMEHTHIGARLEIDVAAVQRPPEAPVPGGDGERVATFPQVWAPPEPLVFADSFEVRIFEGPGGWTLVGAIELVSPSNKDRADRCAAFVAKCAAYLHAGVSVVIVDVVTERHANLHHQLLDQLRVTAARLADDVRLYAAAYRPVTREGRSEFDIWAEPCPLGADLPTMPLRLTGDLFVPVELELAYMETCRSHQAL
jgi:hypothetical protein